MSGRRCGGRSPAAVREATDEDDDDDDDDDEQMFNIFSLEFLQHDPNKIANMGG